MDMTGHNSNELTPKERKALLMHHMRAISAQVAICDRENEERKRLRKLAKADGIPLTDIDYGLRVLEIDDPDIITNELERHRELADWFGVPLYTQATMDFDREPAVDRARREGRAAGAMGKDNDPPYGEGTAQASAWREGWQEEQADMLASLGAAMEKRNAAKRMEAEGLNSSEPEGENATFEDEGGDGSPEGDNEASPVGDNENAEWEAAAPTAPKKRGRPKKAEAVAAE